jgi:uncharacterized protein YukE
MSVEVTPGALSSAARACDQGAATTAGVLASLRAAGAPDTGRADSRAAVAALLERLDRAIAGLGTALTADADALRSAAATYVRTDGRIAAGRQP